MSYALYVVSVYSLKNKNASLSREMEYTCENIVNKMPLRVWDGRQTPEESQPKYETKRDTFNNMISNAIFAYRDDEEDVKK